MIIVIDGPSGSGKSTLAKKLSESLGIAYFDTGAMYRSFCWFLINQKIDPEDQKKIQEVLPKFNFEIKRENSVQRYSVNGVDVSLEIRSEEVTRKTSQISSYLFVREYLVDIQRRFGAAGTGIFEGRDMGTVVFPNADIKFFLYADPNIRAMRRFQQLKENFPLKKFAKEKVLDELIKRDQYDSSRQHSPLKQADDAITIDVSYLSIEDVFEKMIKHINER